MPTLPPISPEVFKAYQDEISKNTSPATAKRKAVSLNKFFDWASTQGHIPVNPIPRPEGTSSFVITPKKGKASTRAWAIVGITSSMVVLIFLLLYQLKFPIPFIKSFAQESKIQTLTNNNLQTIPPGSTQLDPGTIPANSAVVGSWNLFAKLKLSEADGSPRVGSESLTFKLFDSESEGKELYSSSAQDITTDSEGSALISLADVPSNLFFENNTLFLEPQVGSGSATARIPVSTASTPAVDLGGNIVLTSESPSIKAKSGNLLIEGQTVTVKATDGSGGGLEFNPDANGIAHFLFEGNKGNFLNAQGPNLTSGSLYYGMVPNNATGYDLIRLQSGAPKMKTRFSVDALGNTYIAGNENVVGNIATNGTDRLTSAGALQNITGYSQTSGNFTIVQSPGDFASINKTVTSGGALSDVLTLTLDERGKPATSNSDYSTLVLNRYDGSDSAMALLVKNGNAQFNGQLRLGRFDTNPTAIGTGSIIYNSSTNQVFFWDGTAWIAMGTGASTAFTNITSGTNLTATMIVGTGASLTFSGTGTITASDVTCVGCVSNAELANSSITFAGETGSSAIALGATENIVGGSTITTDQTGATLTINVTDDSLDFAQLKDLLTLDAATDIATGGFTLSTSGTGALNFASTGQVTFAGNVDATNGLDVTGSITQNTFAVCDSSGANCPTQAQYWDQAAGALYPASSTVDVLIGSSATASADFAFTGVNGGLPTASIAGNIANVATFIDGNGNISSTNRNNLTIGNSATYDTTGNILLNPNGTGFVGIGTTNPNTSLQVLRTSSASQISQLQLSNSSVAANTGTGIDFNMSTTNTFINSSIRSQRSAAADGNLEFFTRNSAGTLGERVRIDAEGNVGIGDTSPDAKLEVLATTEQLRLTHTDGTADTRFTVDSGGDLTILPSGGDISLTGNLIPTTDSTYNLGGSATVAWANIWGDALFQNGNAVCDSSGLNCPFSGGYWGQTLGALYPINNGVDLLIGSDSTASAKFAFKNVSSGTPTASIAGSIANVATYLTGDGTLSTTNAQALTLGSSTTGNVILNSRGSDALTADGANVTIAGDLAVNGGDITTNQTTFNLINATATTLNFGGAATTFNIGPTGASGSIAFSGGSADTGCTLDGTTGNLTCSGNITATGDLVSTAGNLTTSSTGTATVFNTNATTLNIGGDATTISIGDATGTTTINNALAVTLATNLNGDTTIGNAITDNITFTGRVAQDSDLIPITTTGTNTLGTALLPWDNIYGVALFQNGNAVCDSTGANCPSSAQYWDQIASGVLYPVNSSVDVLIGGTATTSAKFAFINVLTGVPTASIAGNIANVATFLTGNGTLGTTNNQPLNIGNATTGPVIIGSNDQTVNINSSDWDIDTTGTMTGIGNIGTNGSLTMTQGTPTIFFVDNTAASDDYSIQVDASAFDVTNATDTRQELQFVGDGSINFGDNTATKTIDIGGVTNSAADTINIATNATAADIITIGNANAATTLALTGGTSWSIGTNGNIANSGDLTITPSGGQLILADTATLNVGGKTNVGYNTFANAADAPAATTAITADNDLFIGGDLELKGGLYLTGKNIYNLVGTTPTATISLATDPSLVDTVNTLGNGSWLVQNDANAGIAALIVNQTYLTPDIFTASAGGTMRFKIANDGTTTILTTNAATVASLVVSDSSGTGTGKIDVGTVDPPYTINGKKFATFLSAMTGVKEETAGLVNTNEYVPGIGYRSIIDFNNLPEGSDLWLFGKTTNIKENMDKLVALLTPSSSTRVWYDMDRTNNKLVIYSARPTEISYRLTGPRFDAQIFPNQRSESDSTTGFVINSPDTINNSLVVAEAQQLASFVTEKVQDGFYILRDSSGTIVDGFESIGNFVAGNIKAGAIQTQEIASNSFNAFQGTVDNLLVSSGLVTPRAQIALISPIPGGTNVAIRLGNESTASGKLVVEDRSGAEVASIDSAGNASFSGELYAKNIHSTNLDEIQAMLTQVKTDQDILAQVQNSSNLTATGSANLDQIAVSNLFVTGQAAMNSLSVTNNFMVGTDFAISQVSGSDNSGTSLDTLSAPLKIQSLAMAPIELMAGLVTIDTNGNVNIRGDLFVAGEIKTQKGFKVQDINLNDVASIDATGSAMFNSISTGGLIIGASDATVSGVVANGEINTSSTIGKAVIPTGTSEITIRNPKVTDYTLVYVTPTSETQNYVLYIKEKANGYFKVGFDRPLSIDVSFNWWVVEVSQ